MKTIRSRLLLIALLAAGSVFFLIPRTTTERSYDATTGQMVERQVRRIPIRLGLDLRGGSYFALELDTARAPVPDCAAAIQEAARVIRNRISEFGTMEPVVQVTGGCRLIVELPGERDPARARSIVQRSAFLELRLVDGEGLAPSVISAMRSAMAGGSGGKQASGEGDASQWGVRNAGTLMRGALPGQYLVPEQDRMRVQQALDSARARRLLPATVDVRWGTHVRQLGGASYRPFYTLNPRPLVTGRDLVSATAARDPMTSQPQVRFRLNGAAGRSFAHATGSHIGDYLAILLDGRVQGQPAVIRDRIESSGVIELPGRTMQDASDLALVLRAGALPAPLRIVEERTVGPSLGSDSIAAGVRTSLLAVVLVVLAMILYYRFSGILAAVALGLYLLYTLGGLAVFGFTLTLPGIAGFALAIGMAVDANVLIFERIREELEAGKPPRVAVDRGFRNALGAIVDSNVTTALTALILHAVGSDAVKGFAVTLLVGLCASMFAAVFVTRTLFLLWLRRRGRQPVLRYRTIRPLDRTYDFMRLRRRVFAVSGTLIVAGLLMLAARGVRYGVDFTGGTLLQVHTERPVPTRVIRSALAAGPLGSAEIQKFGSDRDFIVRTRPAQTGDDAAGTASAQAREALDAGLGHEAYKLVRTEEVGPKVGGELQQKAGLAIVASFGATLAYLAARFEWRFGLAAVVATAHDILATVAFIGAFGLEVNLVTVAGILTVLGYSLNDTIVIFDRVRENLRARPRAGLREVLNTSINETLPRTVLTAGTTLLAALLLAVFAGEVIRPLALVLSFGIVVGTLSSIFVASPVLLWLRRRSAGSSSARIQ